jgi:hypothetical protein
VRVVLLEAAVVLGMVGLIIFGTITLLTRSEDRPQALSHAGARWRTAHDDAEYDAKFLEAMAQARQRAALFEAEEG